MKPIYTDRVTLELNSDLYELKYQHVDPRKSRRAIKRVTSRHARRTLRQILRQTPELI